MKNIYLQKGTGKQRTILKTIKQTSNLNWKQITKILEVNRSMLFKYLNEDHSMPLKRLEKLCKATKIDITNFGKLELIELQNVKEHKIVRPKLNETLAEFLGALSGDGNIYGKNYEISITCGAVVDQDYVVRIVKKMFKNLFGLEAHIYKNKSVVKCRIYSKQLQQFLSNEFNFPIGKRKNRTFIPPKIRKEKKLRIAYLRGLFDTDGSFHRRRPKSGVVEFISASPDFLLQVQKALKKLGFKACLSGENVYIYDQRQVDTFFKTVKPSNNKHSLKYRIFKKTGLVPLHKEFVQAVVA